MFILFEQYMGFLPPQVIDFIISLGSDPIGLIVLLLDPLLISAIEIFPSWDAFALGGSGVLVSFLSLLLRMVPYGSLLPFSAIFPSWDGFSGELNFYLSLLTYLFSYETLDLARPIFSILDMENIRNDLANYINLTPG